MVDEVVFALCKVFVRFSLIRSYLYEGGKVIGASLKPLKHPAGSRLCTMLTLAGRNDYKTQQDRSQDWCQLIERQGGRIVFLFIDEVIGVQPGNI